MFVVEGVTLAAFLENACEAVDKLPDVLERKGVGRPRFDSKSRIIALLVKAWIGRGYRDTEVYLYDNKETRAKFNLKSQTITSFGERCVLPETYLKDLNRQIGMSLKKGNPK